MAWLGRGATRLADRRFYRQPNGKWIGFTPLLAASSWEPELRACTSMHYIGMAAMRLPACADQCWALSAEQGAWERVALGTEPILVCSGAIRIGDSDSSIFR